MRRNKYLYAPGADHNVYCDRCNFKYAASQCSWETEFGKQTYFVCNRCWEPQHPQEFLTGVQDDMSVDPVRNKDGSERLPLGAPPYPTTKDGVSS